MKIIKIKFVALAAFVALAGAATPPLVHALNSQAAPVVKTAKGFVALRPVVPVPGVKISRITVVHHGSVAVPDAPVLAVLSQKVGGLYDAAAAQQDTKAIKSLGLFRGAVLESASADPSGGVDLTYTVTENPFIKTILLTANTPDGQPSIPAALLKAQMETKENMVLNTTSLNRDMYTLSNRTNGLFWKQGFFVDAGVTQIDPVTETLTIPLLETHIARIQVQGNTQVSTEEIMQQIKSQPGDVFNDRVMQADMTRIWNMGKFNIVGPLTETTDADHQMTIIIPISEKKTIPQTN